MRFIQSFPGAALSLSLLWVVVGQHPLVLQGVAFIFPVVALAWSSNTTDTLTGHRTHQNLFGDGVSGWLLRLEGHQGQTLTVPCG